MVGVSEWDLATDIDHGRSEKRAVTLIQAEHLPALSQMLGCPVDFAALFGHGGWCARIVRSGVIRVGDTVRLADVAQQRLFDA